MKKQTSKQVSMKVYVLTVIILLGGIGYALSAGESPITLLTFASPSSYIIGIDGLDTYMRNGDTGEVTRSTNSTLIAEACIGNLTFGGKIYIKGNVTIEALTINKLGIHIIGDAPAYQHYITGYPMIKHLTYTTPTDEELGSGLVENLYVGELIFRPDNYQSLHGLTFRNVNFPIARSQNSYGIVMNATFESENQSNYADFILFDHCGITGSAMEGYGLVNFVTSGGGTSSWVFDNCGIGIYTYENQSIFKWFNTGFGNRMKFINGHIYTGQTNTTIVDFGSSTKSSPTFRNDGIEFYQNALELHNDVTLVRILSGNKTNRRIHATYKDNVISAYDNLVMINNTLNAFAKDSYVEFIDNNFDPVNLPVAGNTTIGDPNESANFAVYVSNNVGFVTENRGESTGTSSEQALAHGLADTPTYVFFSNVDDGANPYLSSASNATHIHVTAVNTKDYSYEAIYEVE